MEHGPNRGAATWNLTEFSGGAKGGLSVIRRNSAGGKLPGCSGWGSEQNPLPAGGCRGCNVLRAVVKEQDLCGGDAGDSGCLLVNGDRGLHCPDPVAQGI